MYYAKISHQYYTQFEWMDVERPDWYIDDCTTMDGQVITWRLRIKSEE